MTRRQISSGSKFEAEIGYSRAIVDGDRIWVSGTTGFNYDTMTISEDVAEQADQTFRNIKAAMEKAGFGLADVVSVTYIFPRAEDFEPCWPVFRKYLGEIKARRHRLHRRADRSAHEDRDPGDRQKTLTPRLTGGGGCPIRRLTELRV